MKKNIALGVDIGGSHIFCAAVDLTTHSLIPQTGAQEAINNKASAEEILGGWSKAIETVLSKIDRNQLAGIGFAMPGPFDYPNGVALFERVEKYESLYGINISEALGKMLGLSPDVSFRYINDATAFAIAEAWIGKGAGHDRIMALTLGTGFGSAFIKNGAPVIEGDGVPELGCVWHLPYKDGIADDYFSTRWFERNYTSRTGKILNGVKEIAEMAQSETIAADLFSEYGSNMGDFLSPWIRKFGANAIVVGGNITRSFGLFGPALHQSFAKQNIEAGFFISELKEDAAVIGSARLIDDDYWPEVKDLLSKM